MNLTYHPEGRVSVEMLPRGQKVRVGGTTSRDSNDPGWRLRDWVVR